MNQGETNGLTLVLPRLDSPRILWTVIIRHPTFFTLGHIPWAILGAKATRYTPNFMLLHWLGLAHDPHHLQDHPCCLPSLRRAPDCEHLVGGRAIGSEYPTCAEGDHLGLTRSMLERAKGYARRFAVIVDLDELHKGLSAFCSLLNWCVSLSFFVTRVLRPSW